MGQQTQMSSPILIFGDPYISKNNIISAKDKYKNVKWVTKSASVDSLDEIRSEACLTSWEESEKILLIQDLPNKKQVRDFLVSLVKTSPKSTKIIVWDSSGFIKIDPKTQALEKTWSDFVSEFRKIGKVVNNGDHLTEKKNDDCYSFVTQCFEKHKKQISPKDVRLLMGIVGYDRGMLISDINKMCLNCPDKVDSKFIIENAFPTTKESVLYKLSDVLDSGSYEDVINSIDRFLGSGINSNVIAEIFVRKARWQMVAAYLWSSGMSWEQIPDKIMEMGKFPSSIWHSQQLDSGNKRREAEIYQTPENMIKFLVRKEGIPSKYFKSHKETKVTKKTSDGKTIARKNSESMPMYFMASQVVSFVRDKIVRASNIPINDLKKKVVDRSIYVYLFSQDKLAEIRYGGNPVQDLQEMARAIFDTRIEQF